MKTEVVMKRKLFDSEISQKSKTEFFSATDLVKAGNKWRISREMTPFSLAQWFTQKSTKEFVKQLERKYGTVKIAGRGRGNHTWVHPILMIDIALAISPELKIEVYEWLFDYLIAYRNNSGESYKLMCGALWENEKQRTFFKENITNAAIDIQKACNVKDWQRATQEQLELRDKIHEQIAIFAGVLRDNSEAVRLGIIAAKNMFEKRKVAT